MTDRMRKALEQIASGVGPLGARLGYDEMRGIAQAELTVLAAQERGIRISDGMADLMAEAVKPISHAEMREKESRGLREQFDQNGYDAFMAAKRAAELKPDSEMARKIACMLQGHIDSLYSSGAAKQLPGSAIPENLDSRLPGCLDTTNMPTYPPKLSAHRAECAAKLKQLAEDGHDVFTPQGYIVDDLLK